MVEVSALNRVEDPLAALLAKPAEEIAKEAISFIEESGDAPPPERLLDEFWLKNGVPKALIPYEARMKMEDVFCRVAVRLDEG